jgi:hypothetical protein
VAGGIKVEKTLKNARFIYIREWVIERPKRTFDPSKRLAHDAAKK